MKKEMEIEKPDKETIYCAPCDYDKMIKVTDFSFLDGDNPFYGFNVIPSIWCGEDLAYAVDDNWDITTIIIKG